MIHQAQILGDLHPTLAAFIQALADACEAKQADLVIRYGALKPEIHAALQAVGSGEPLRRVNELRQQASLPPLRGIDLHYQEIPHTLSSAVFTDRPARVAILQPIWKTGRQMVDSHDQRLRWEELVSKLLPDYPGIQRVEGWPFSFTCDAVIMSTHTGACEELEAEKPGKKKKKSDPPAT